MRAPEREDLLKVLIHVPKTAGSTVNAHLAEWRPGQDHVEHYRNKPRRLRRKLQTVRWVSGHLALNRMQDLLGAHTDRPLAFYGLIREPISQVASHYNWFLEIAHRGGRFFRSHGAGIRAYSEKLTASDNTDPAVVIGNISDRLGMFMNLQSRFLLGDDLKFSENTGAARLQLYAGLSDDPEDLVEMMTGTRPAKTRRENASPYHVDRRVFDTDEMQQFLRPRLGSDLQLHARIARERGRIRGS